MIPRTGLFAAAALALGCGPNFHALTTPPVTQTARLDSYNETIELSVGVALAFECSDPNGEPCAKATATTADPAVARVLPAYIDDVSERWGPYGPAPHWGWHGPAPRSAFVVWGVAPGTTLLSVRSESGNEELRISVVTD